MEELDGIFESTSNRILNRFYYCLLLRTSWLPRRTDVWSYAGGARWKREARLDIDFEQLQGIYEDCVGSVLPDLSSEEYDDLCQAIGCSEAEQPIDVLSDYFCNQYDESDSYEQIIVPITEVLKISGRTETIAKDANGRQMHFFLPEVEAIFLIAALQGGLDKEYGIIIGENDLLLWLLLDVFKRRGLPIDSSGNEIPTNDVNKYPKLIGWIRKHIETYEEQSAIKTGLSQLEACEAQPLFRYFLETFAYCQLPCLTIEKNEPDRFSSLFSVATYCHEDSDGEYTDEMGRESFFL